MTACVSTPPGTAKQRLARLVASGDLPVAMTTIRPKPQLLHGIEAAPNPLRRALYGVIFGALGAATGWILGVFLQAAREHLSETLVTLFVGVMVGGAAK